jgi:anti-sigma factor RsiW
MVMSDLRHPADGTLNEYLDQMLGSAEREALELHLEGCAACRQRLERLQSLFVALAALPEEAPEPYLAEAVLQKLAASPAAEQPVSAQPASAQPASAQPSPAQPAGFPPRVRRLMIFQAILAALLAALAWPATGMRLPAGFLPSAEVQEFVVRAAELPPQARDLWLQGFSHFIEVFRTLLENLQPWEAWEMLRTAGQRVPYPLLAVVLAAAVLLWLAGNRLALRSPPFRSMGEAKEEKRGL